MSKIPQFAELKNGEYEKLEEVIGDGRIQFPAYVYDEKAQRLIHVNKDGTYSYIQGAPTSYVALTGTAETPVGVSALPDNMYIIDGYYTVSGIDTVYHTDIPLLFIIGTANGIQKITCFSSSNMTTYTVTEEETTVTTPVTSDTVGDIIQDTIEETITPATDEDIDALFDNMFGGGD